MEKLALRQFRMLFLYTVILLAAQSLLANPTKVDFSFSSYSYLSQETVVYVTNTGSKYHRADCRYLSQSKNKTTLKKAVAAGNSACKVCKP